MSKTDKTRPWRVRVMDKKRWLIERHDHATGPCDLPPRPALVCELFNMTATTCCTWEGSREFWTTPSNYCGCRACNDQAGRRRNTKRARAAGRRQVREAWREASADPAHTFGASPPAEREADEITLSDLEVLRGDFDIPATSHIIAGHFGPDPGIELPRAVEVLHNDGRREVVTR